MLLSWGSVQLDEVYCLNEADPVPNRCYGLLTVVLKLQRSQAGGLWCIRKNSYKE